MPTGAVFADISSHQGGANVAAYAAGGHDRLLVKATEGATYTNPFFASWWAAAGRAGLARGAYHFARPSRGPGAPEADRFAAVLRAAGGLGPRDWVCLDTEDPDCRIGRAAAHAAAFCTRMTQLGFGTGVVYSYGPYLAEVGLTAAMLPAGWRRLHIANYNPTSDSVVPLPPGWPRELVVARQFTDAARTAGIPGGSDANRVVREWLAERGVGEVDNADVRRIVAAVKGVLDERDARIRGEAFWVNEAAGEVPVRQENVPRIWAATYRKAGRLESMLAKLLAPTGPAGHEAVLDMVAAYTDLGLLGEVERAAAARRAELAATARGEPPPT